VQTVVFVPGPYGPGDLPPMAEILTAYRSGRSVVTDGPFVETGIDANGDGDFADPGDVTVGGDTSGPSSAALPLTVRWASNADFGPVNSVRLKAGDSSSTTTILSLDPSASGEGWGGERTVDLGTYGFTGAHYFRAECETDAGGDVFRAYSNPIWVTFDGTSVGGAATGLSVSLAGNPFRGSARFDLFLPMAGRAELRIHNTSGRLVRSLEAGWSSAGRLSMDWDGTDERGSPVASGVYLVRLVTTEEAAVAKCVLLR